MAFFLNLMLFLPIPSFYLVYPLCYRVPGVMTVEVLCLTNVISAQQGEVVVILLCYDNHHCFCSVKSTDCRRVTVDELKIMIQRQQVRRDQPSMI